MGIKGKSKYQGKFTSGQRFGKLSIKSGNIILETEAKIEVMCDCGTEKIIPVLPMLKGRIISCGCEMNKSEQEHYAYNGFIGVHKAFQRGAISRNLEFSLSVADIENLYNKQNKMCALSGLPLKIKECSIDRIDSQRGYTTDNVQLVSKHINIMKQNFNQDYFIFLCNRISALHTSKSYHSPRPKKISHQWKYELLFDDGTTKTLTSEELRQFVNQNNSVTNMSRKSHISLHTLIRGKIGTRTGPCQIISKAKI
jgi:hypothetical protein